MTVTETTSLQRMRSEEHSTLQQLLTELERQQETKADYIVDTRRITFSTYAPQEEGELQSFVSFDPEPQGDGPARDVVYASVNEHAHGQISDRLGIPKRYYDRMRGEAPALLDRNVRHWFQEKPEKRMVRTLDGRARAFLSNRYRRLDNLDLMQRSILPELAKYRGDLVFHIASLTDERLYIRAILPELAADVELEPGNHTIRPEGTGDVVQAGVQIRNSEVGSGRLEIAPFIWRLRCLNGLVMADKALSKYHVGREQDEAAYTIFRDDTLAADDKAFFMKVRDAVGAALSDVQFYEIVDGMRAAAQGLTIEEPVAATQKLTKTLDLTDGEGEALLRYLATGGDLSQWGTVNALTASAKEAPTFQRQAELEALGGELLALPEREWAKIAR